MAAPYTSPMPRRSDAGIRPKSLGVRPSPPRSGPSAKRTDSRAATRSVARRQSSPLRSSYRRTPEVAESPSPPIARSSTPLRPDETSATTAPESVGTSASSLKRISVSWPSSREADSYSSRSSSSFSVTDASLHASWPPGAAGTTTPERVESDSDPHPAARPAAGADPTEPGPAAVPAQLMHHRPEDAAAARADRMAERDGAAVDVRLLGIG